MPSTHPVVPGDARPPRDSQDAGHWQYELRPARDLPVVDLSVSLRSRFLSSDGLARVTRCMRHGRLFFVCFAVGVIVLIIVFVTQDVVLIQPLAVMSALLTLPSPLIGLAVLRYDVVCLLVKTYDFWFFNATNVVFFVVFSPLLRDARVFAAFVFSGNIAVLATGVLFFFMIKLNWIVALHPFDVVRYGAHTLPAKALAESCQLTLTAMTARNIYRGRLALQQGNMQEIRCVSLRCALRMRPIRHSSPPPQAVALGAVAVMQPAQTPVQESSTQASSVVPPSVQQLRCVLPVGQMDARTTVVPVVLSVITRSRSAQYIVRLAAACAFSTSVAAATQADYLLDGGRVSQLPTLRLAATTLIGAFVGASFAVYLRPVLRALIISFDFLYISTLLAVIHLTACDFFQWHSSPCLVVLISWLWIHWVLCVDALSPLVKDAFRVHVRFPAVVVTTAIAGAALLLYRMIVLDVSDEPYDRVLWRGVVLGNDMAFTVVPLFYNCMGNVLVFFMRLLYHAVFFDADMLIVLDGPVAYTNHLSRSLHPRQVSAAPLKDRVVGSKL